MATRRPPRPAVPRGLALLVENRRRFLRFLERRVGSREAAEDILQEAFGRAVGRMGSLREPGAVVPWFYRTLRNAVVDHHRRNAAAGRALESFARELERAAPEAEAHAEICACVARLAGTLKPEYAEALRRVEVDGLAVREFAMERGLTPGNAAVRVFRARAALKKQVVASCGACARHGCLDCRCQGRRDARIARPAGP